MPTVALLPVSVKTVSTVAAFVPLFLMPMSVNTTATAQTKTMVSVQASAELIQLRSYRADTLVPLLTRNRIAHLQVRQGSLLAKPKLERRKSADGQEKFDWIG